MDIVTSPSIGVAVGDLHVRPLNDFSRHIGPDGLTPLGKNLIETAQWLTTLTLECSDNPWFINNGDYTDSPGRLDAPTLFLLSKLEDVWKSLPDKILNIGNHDINSKIGLHNLALHSKIPGYSIPSCNSVLRHTSGLYIVPFTYSIDDQIKLLQSIPDDSIVAVHTAIQGAYLNPFTNDTGVPLEEFQRFALTLAGHYHSPQYLHGGSRTLFNSGMGGNYFRPSPGSVLILGTPLPHSFADTGDAYGAWVVNVEDNLSVVFHLNPHAPKYLNVNIGSLAELRECQYPAGCQVYLSLTAPQTLHKEILATGVDGVTAFRLRCPIVGAPKRDQVIVPPPREGGISENLMNSLLSYLDSVGQPYDRVAVERDVSEELGRISPDRHLGGRIKFIRMQVENFLSYEEAKIELGTPGFWLVSGVNLDTESSDGNGSGKSGLIEALVWCLYGDLLRESPSKDAIVRKGGDRCRVEVEFEANGETYKVTRRRHRSTSKTTISLHVLTSGSWAEISPGSVAESNKQIVQTLGIKQEDFLLTSIFASYIGNNFATVKDSDKKQFLSRVYELDIFDKLLEKYKDKLQRVSREIFSLEVSIKAQEDRENEARESYEKKRISAEREIQERQQSISSAEELLASTCPRRDLISVILLEKKKLLVEMQGSLQKNREDEIRLDALNSDLRREEKIIEDTSSALWSPYLICSSCGQDLLDEAKKEYVRKLQETLDKINREHEVVLARKKDLEAQISTCTTSSEKISSLQETIADLEKVHRELSDTISSLSEKVRVLRSLPDPAESLRELEDLLAEYSQKISTLRGKFVKLQGEKDLYNLLAFALGPRGVVSYVLDRSVDQLNSYLEHVSRTLYAGDYSVWLSSTKELKDGRDANVITLQYSTSGGSFGLSSGGEKRKAEIALFLAVNYLLTSQGRGTTNLIMLDEALDSLDAKAASSAVESLRRFVDEEGKTGFLISHSDSVRDLIDRQIIVERHNEISRIAYNGFVRDSYSQRV